MVVLANEILVHFGSADNLVDMLMGIESLQHL